MVVARVRYPLLALGIAALACGVWGGLSRFGWSPPGGRASLAELHGPLMVFGFLGTVVSLERAVALRRPWGYLAPAGTVAGSALLLAGVRQGVGELVLLLAGCVLVGLFVVVLRARATAPAATLALGALLWVAGDVLWLHGDPLVQVVPWWAGFLVATIVGERLELAALGRLTGPGRAAFAGLTLLLLSGLSLSAADASAGIRLAGVALAGYALWLARFDIARRTLRRPGLPRFVALALLPGYAWLGVGGLLWLRHGAVLAGPAHDAELHAIFLGFVFSMIFGHAPVIFPGVIGIAIPFRRPFYAHLVLLHAGLALRIGGDLAGSYPSARWGGLLNATAIGLFLVATIATALVARRAERARRRAPEIGSSPQAGYGEARYSRGGVSPQNRLGMSLARRVIPGGREPAGPGFRLLTAFAALAAWALVAVGGVVRVTASGLGCPHWPLCTADAVPLDERASMIEYSHRAVVALVSVLVVAVAIRAWQTQRSRPEVLWPALTAVALVPFQALLGAVAVWLELPGWVVAFHFVVGLLFLATIVLTAVAAWRSPEPSATAGFALLARAGVLVGVVLVSIGAAVVATDADTACGTDWPACNGGFATGGGHAQLQVAHRMLAYTLAVVAVALLVLALRGRGPRLAGTLPALVVLAQIGLGIGIVVAGGDGRTHEILAGAHEAGAGLVWGVLIALAGLARPTRERSPAAVVGQPRPETA